MSTMSSTMIDVRAVERRVEILEQPHFAGAGRALGVARDRHEVERDRPQRQRA